MVNNSGLCPVVGVESGQVPAVGLAGARLLTETSRVTGLGNELSQALSTWRRPGSVHDPGKIILDLVVCVALGSRRLSDLSLLRCEKEVFGPVASDPMVSRLIGALADHVEAVEAAVNWARRTLHTGADLLTDTHARRLETLFADDRHAAVQASGASTSASSTPDASKTT